MQHRHMFKISGGFSKLFNGVKSCNVVLSRCSYSWTEDWGFLRWARRGVGRNGDFVKLMPEHSLGPAGLDPSMNYFFSKVDTPSVGYVAALVGQQKRETQSPFSTELDFQAVASPGWRVCPSPFKLVGSVDDYKVLKAFLLMKGVNQTVGDFGRVQSHPSVIRGVYHGGSSPWFRFKAGKLYGSNEMKYFVREMAVTKFITGVDNFSGGICVIEEIMGSKADCSLLFSYAFLLSKSEECLAQEEVVSEVYDHKVLASLSGV